MVQYIRTMKRQAIVCMLVGIVLVCGCSRFRPPRGVKPQLVDVLTTGYCRCGACCGWHRNWYLKPVYSSGPNKGQRKQVGVTASSTRARKGTLAADTSVFPFGTIFYIDGYGYGRVEDRGGAIKGRHLDLFFHTHKEAQQWGRATKRVKVWLPKR